MRAGILYSKRIYSSPNGSVQPWHKPIAIQCGQCPRLSKNEREHEDHFLFEHAEHARWRSWG